jgi:hypothetical protein
MGAKPPCSGAMIPYVSVVRGLLREVTLTVLDRHAAHQPLPASQDEADEHVFLLRYSHRGRDMTETFSSELAALHRARSLLGKSSIGGLADENTAGRIEHDEASIRAIGKLFKLRHADD